MITLSKHSKHACILIGLASCLLCSGCTLSHANSGSTRDIKEDIVVHKSTNSEEVSSSSDDYIILAENNGIVITTTASQDNLLRDISVDVRGEQKRTFQWNAVVDETRPPIIDEVDVNADGIKEIVIRLNAGRGTELSINDIHVLHPDTLDELHVEDPVTALNEQLKSSIEQRNGKTYIDMELNGRHISRVYDYEGSSWSENIGFGSIVSYEVVDGYLQARLDGRASITEFPVHVVADYGSDLSIQDVKLYYSSFLQPSFTEEDVKYMVEQWLPGGEITFDPKSDQYTVVYPVETGKGEPMMLKINPQTGTVYDATSGSPRMNFANREALDLPPFSNGTLYYEELHRLLEPILDAASLKLVSPESWFSGFLGDGYLMIEVVQAEREVTIKIDAFTGQWEVMGEHS